MSRRVTLAVLAIVTPAAPGCRQLFGIDDTEVLGDAGPADGPALADGPGPDPDAAFDAKIDAAPDAQPDGAVGLCPVSYLMSFGGHVYRYGTFQNVWDAARDDCANDGNIGAPTYLAVPDDDAENAQISQWLATRAWIGVTDSAVEGAWMTVLGQPASYTNWETGAPNVDANHNCVSLKEQAGAEPGTWRDDACGLNRAFVCECP